MAGKTRTTAAHLKARLLKEGERFSFFQAIRLLRLLLREQGVATATPWRHIRVRPKLSLAFPETDVDRIEELPDGAGYRVTANFFGLYGVSSPLPTFYTEDVLDETLRDKRAVRDFLDIFHYALYPVLFDAWAKYRQTLKVVEENAADYLDRLFAFVGLGVPGVRAEVPGAYGLLRYAGLLSQFPRSALGLQTLLSDALEGTRVEVISCVERKVSIPPDQRMVLGENRCALGRNAFLGQELRDRAGSIVIRIGPVEEQRFHELLPGERMHNRVRFLVRFYLVDPLHSEVELVLRAGEVQPTSLGSPAWSRLGLDTWMFSGRHGKEVRAGFALYK